MALAPVLDFSGDRTLVLTDVEANLRQLLLDVAKFINPEKPSELRYTGGWVRDKLLRIGSNDIDVAISDMTGYQFGLKMKEYLEQPGNMAKYGIQGVSKDEKSAGNSGVVSGLHKIEANPEKSKHLETVTTKVFGLDIDLVNLRKETYTEDSRTPQMEFGTAEEDALRRDATINAMFYNLQTSEVEDLTGKGFDDLRDKIIRTPLEPYQTFKDDPLRVLRLIRFASRLDYQVEPDATKAMRDPTIQEALRAKISRERVGTELEKMLKGNDPHYALRLINDNGLYSTIFVDPTVEDDYEPEVKTWPRVCDFILHLLKNSEGEATKILLPDSQHQYLGWIASCLAPWRDAPTPEPSKQNKRPVPVIVSVAREGFKAPNKVSDTFKAAFQNREEIESTLQSALDAQRKGKDLARDELGMKIRSWGSSWRTQVLFAIIAELLDLGRDPSEILARHRPLLSMIQKYGLLEAYDFKTLIDGKMLAKELGTQPGPWMKEALDVVMAWQLCNPDNKSVADAVQAVQDHNGELVASLVRHFLELTIRPLFSKTRPPDMTEQGYKSMTPVNPHERSRDMSDDFSDEKPAWKREVQTVKILRWCTRVLHPKLTEAMWPLLIPPLLRIVDDADTKYKVLGCELLRNLFGATSPELLRRTGLGQMFENTLTTTLAFLPSLTPEDESIQIQNAAYPALLALARVQFTSPDTLAAPSPGNLSKGGIHEVLSDKSQEAPSPTTPAYTAFLRSILHKQLFPAINHTLDTNPKLLATLLGHLSSLVTEMGTHSIAQLKDIIPLTQSILIDPFVVTASPELLQATLKTTQVAISCAWPRVPFWRGELWKGVCGAYLNVENELDDLRASKDRADKAAELRELQREIRRCAEMLVAACRADMPGDEDAQVDVEAEIGELLGAEPRLEGLLAGF